jgi:ABC-type multidrug transport system ATPase subunit
MKRRLSVAISIVSDPKIIYLDEPTTGLDPESKRQLWDILAKLKGKRAVILTTHSMEEADVLCNRIAIIN